MRVTCRVNVIHSKIQTMVIDIDPKNCGLRDKHPSAAIERAMSYPFPDTGGGAVSGGTHSPIPIACALGGTGRSFIIEILDFMLQFYRARGNKMSSDLIQTKHYFIYSDTDDFQRENVADFKWVLNLDRALGDLERCVLISSPSGSIRYTVLLSCENMMRLQW